MKISRKVREEAALAMAICASQRESWPWFFDDITKNPSAQNLCRLAWDATYDDDDDARHWRERYAEAESLLRCGWSPGDEA